MSEGKSCSRLLKEGMEISGSIRVGANTMQL